MIRYVWFTLVLSVQLTWGQTTETELYLRGKLRLQDEAFESAVRDFSYVLQLNEKHEEALLYRGVAHLELEQADLAYIDLSRQIELHGGNGMVYYHRSKAAQAQGENEMALDDIRIALIYEPKESTFYHWYARLLLSQKRYEEALEPINKAIRFTPDRFDYLFDRIEVWLGMEQPNFALRDVAFLVRRIPKDPRVYSIRAAIYFQEGDRRAACKDWGAAAALGDQSVLTLIQQFCDQRMEYSRNK